MMELPIETDVFLSRAANVSGQVIFLTCALLVLAQSRPTRAARLACSSSSLFSIIVCFDLTLQMKRKLDHGTEGRTPFPSGKKHCRGNGSLR